MQNKELYSVQWFDTKPVSDVGSISTVYHISYPVLEGSIPFQFAVLQLPLTSISLNWAVYLRLVYSQTSFWICNLQYLSLCYCSSKTPTCGVWLFGRLVFRALHLNTVMSKPSGWIIYRHIECIKNQCEDELQPPHYDRGFE